MYEYIFSENEQQELKQYYNMKILKPYYLYIEFDAFGSGGYFVDITPHKRKKHTVLKLNLPRYAISGKALNINDIYDICYHVLNIVYANNFYVDKLTDKGIKIVSDILSNNYNTEYIKAIDWKGRGI